VLNCDSTLALCSVALDLGTSRQLIVHLRQLPALRSFEPRAKSTSDVLHAGIARLPYFVAYLIQSASNGAASTGIRFCRDQARSSVDATTALRQFRRMRPIKQAHLRLISSLGCRSCHANSSSSEIGTLAPVTSPHRRQPIMSFQGLSPLHVSRRFVSFPKYREDLSTDGILF